MKGMNMHQKMVSLTHALRSPSSCAARQGGVRVAAKHGGGKGAAAGCRLPVGCCCEDRQPQDYFSSAAPVQSNRGTAYMHAPAGT